MQTLQQVMKGDSAKMYLNKCPKLCMLMNGLEDTDFSDWFMLNKMPVAAIDVGGSKNHKASSSSQRSIKSYVCPMPQKRRFKSSLH